MAFYLTVLIMLRSELYSLLIAKSWIYEEARKFNYHI